MRGLRDTLHWIGRALIGEPSSISEAYFCIAVGYVLGLIALAVIVRI